MRAVPRDADVREMLRFLFCRRIRNTIRAGETELDGFVELLRRGEIDPQLQTSFRVLVVGCMGVNRQSR